MIKIKPYYRLGSKGEDMLKMYLRMVADVVPFPTEDVLYDDAEGIRLSVKKQEKRVKGAEMLIRDYSKKLHEYLYGGCKDGHVNPEKLRDLLTFTMPEGRLPERLVFKDCDKERSKQLRQNVFRYNAFSRHKDMYTLVQSFGVEVCPYCNRQFTTTVDSEKKRSRPQLDHFKNKSDYPYLALSINNLIPSCAVCNLLKHEKDAEMVYPYEEAFGDDYVFSMKLSDDQLTPVMTGAIIAPEHFEIKLKSGERGNHALEQKIEASMQVLALEELYQSHRHYVAALVFQRYIITDAMIDDLYSQFGERLFESRDEIRMALTLMNTQPEHWGERPLAKLTHDIQREFDS